MRRILLSRTDAIGDVTLTLPMAGFLKSQIPDSEILFLGTDYTLPVVNASVHISQGLNWTSLQQLPDEKIIRFLKELAIECIIHVFPDKRIAGLAKKAKIPQRIGTGHRLFHFLTCNNVVHFSRRKSELHEAQLNFKLLKPLGFGFLPELSNLAEMYGLQPEYSIPEWLATCIKPSGRNIVIHPKSRGSAREWSLDRYQQLVDILIDRGYTVFVTGTKLEGDNMKPFLDANRGKIHDVTGRLTLEELIGFIHGVDGLIACSTGPLHIAAALGKVAIGIYPPIKPMHPGRWAPVGKMADFLVVGHECNKCRHQSGCECIEEITPESIVTVLDSFLKPMVSI